MIVKREGKSKSRIRGRNQDRRKWKNIVGGGGVRATEVEKWRRRR
jgi:hypothetical protein